MSGLRKKLNSLGTETGLMEMMLAGVKSAMTRQQFRVPLITVSPAVNLKGPTVMATK